MHTMPPPEHCSVPSVHSPVSVRPHDPSTMPSSKVPSQSSSWPSQVLGSAPGVPIAPTPVREPPWQRNTPATHSPRSEPHGPPPSGSPSSAVPLQLLSTSSQTSGVGTTPVHSRTPALHSKTPSEHGGSGSPH